MAERDSTRFESLSDGRFATTRWTIVSAAARRTESPEVHRALASLCQGYWFPIYAYLRRRGYRKDQAEDYTQAFFAHLLEKHGLQHVKPSKYRFRSYLLAALNNFLITDWRRERALSRGGGKRFVSLEVEDAEHRYSLEPTDALSPERLFDRSWALAVIHRSLEALRSEYESAGKQKLFERLKGHITQEQYAGTYAEVAADLGISEGAARVTVYRMRARLGELIRAEVAETVNSSEQLEEEIGELFTALGW
jgi:RNA polymerase sigma-70 factor (ECF subfamily)